MENIIGVFFMASYWLYVMHSDAWIIRQLAIGIMVASVALPGFGRLSEVERTGTRGLASNFHLGKA